MAKAALFSVLLLVLGHAEVQATEIVNDGQTIVFSIVEGVAKGSYTHTFNKKKGTLGPTRVISISANKLVFRGRRDTCTMFGNGTVKCAKIGSGTWRLK